jgi:hypothetical protein
MGPMGVMKPNQTESNRIKPSIFAKGIWRD